MLQKCELDISYAYFAAAHFALSCFGLSPSLTVPCILPGVMGGTWTVRAWIQGSWGWGGRGQLLLRMHTSSAGCIGLDSSAGSVSPCCFSRVWSQLECPSHRTLPALCSQLPDLLRLMDSFLKFLEKFIVSQVSSRSIFGTMTMVFITTCPIYSCI